MFNLRKLPSALLLLCAVASLVGCGGGGISDSLNLSQVAVDSGRSATATVGPDGGVVTATAATGEVYTLTIPAGALTESTKIGLYPVRSIKGLPFSGGLAAGFHLTPEGLTFAKQATLTVLLKTTPVAGSITGFGYSGDGVELHLYPMTVSGSTLSFPIYHFSGGGGGNGTGVVLPPGSAGARAEHDIAVLLNNPNQIPQAADIVTILTRWYDATVKPNLSTLVTSIAPFSDLDEYRVWKSYIEDGPWPPALQAQVINGMTIQFDEAASLATNGIKSLISRSNQQCISDNDILKAKIPLRYQKAAAKLHLDNGTGLDLPTVLQNLCVKVKIVSVSDAGFPPAISPSTLNVGDSGSLQFRVGYQLGTNPVKFDQQMAVTVIPNFATDNTQRSGIVNDGQHTIFGGAWTRAGAANPLRIHIFAHFFFEALVSVSADLYLEAGGAVNNNLAGGYRGTADFGGSDNAHPCQFDFVKNDDGTYRFTFWKLVGVHNDEYPPFPFATLPSVTWTPPTYDGVSANGLAHLSGKIGSGTYTIGNGVDPWVIPFTW